MTADQGALFDLPAGRALRDVGAALAGGSSDAAERWREDATAVVDRLAYTGGTFTADDVVAEVGMPPRPNQLGAVFLHASRAGVIRPVGLAQARRAPSHARAHRVWTGARWTD